MKAKALKFTKNHGFHGNGRFSRKEANFTENVTAVKSWIKLVPKNVPKTGVVSLRKITSALYLVVTPMTSLNTSLRNTGWRSTVIKSVYQKWHFIRAAVPFKIPFLDKLMASVGVSWNRKLISFSLICRKQRLTRTVTLICWRLPYCLNVIDSIWTVTFNSCKTVPSHCAKVRNGFYDRTLQTSLLLMNGHHILQILIL